MKILSAKLMLLLVSLLQVALVQALPVVINVDCNKKTVGIISVDMLGLGISGGFDTSNFGSLAQATKACGAHHFNWYQIVVSDNGKAMDSKAGLLLAPYIDPPAGGYLDQWEDSVPWYWNETKGPSQNKTELSFKVRTKGLIFSDFPTSVGSITFRTWLVSLNADSSLHAWHEGFDWTYKVGEGVTSITRMNPKTDPKGAECTDLLKGFDSKIEHRKRR